MASKYANNDCHFDWQLQPSHTSKDGNALLRQIEIHLSDNQGAMTIPALLFKAFIYVSDYRKDPASSALKCLETAGEEISKCQNKEGAIGYKIVYHSLLAKIHEDILMKKAKAKDHQRKLKELTKERTEVSTAFIDSVRAFALSRLGPPKLDESINYFQRAVHVCQRNMEWLFGLALVYGRKTKLVQGLSKTEETERSRYERTLYENILKIDPEHINATLFLAEVLFQEGKIEESSLKYEQVLKIAPDNMKVNTRSAKFFRKSKQWQKALTLIEKAEQLTHTKPDSMLHHEKALIYIDKYDTNDESLEGYVLPGETSRKSLLQMALSEVNKAVQLSTRSVFFGLERAKLYQKLEQFDDADNEFLRLLRVKSEKSWSIDVVRLFLEYGHFLERTDIPAMHDTASAMEYIKQAIEKAVQGCTSQREDGTTEFFNEIRKDIVDAILSYEDFYTRQISTDAKDYNASNSLGWLKQTLADFQINFKDPTTAMEYYQRVYSDTMEESNSLEKECLCESLKGLVECHATDKHLDKSTQYLQELKLLDEDMANTVEEALIAKGITLQGGITSIEQDTGEELRTIATAVYATDDLPLQYEDLVFGKKLGVGVLQVTFKNGKYKGYEEAAAKGIQVVRGKQKPLVTEVSIMKTLQHQNIVRFLDFISGPPATAPGHPDPYYIVMEKGECSLYTYLESDKQLEMPLQNKWAQEAAAAICYLHDNDIVHRDIKPENCLIFPEQVLKVSDFGISCEGNGTRHTSNKRGTDMYTAPEVEEHRTYSKASDIWAFGILLWHIYARSGEYGSSFPPPLKDDFPRIMKGLLPSCWKRNPHERLSIDYITDEVLSCL